MKINCEIIQDLIPSYVEEICSNASKQCVEEHIADCKECNQLVELYKKSDFSAHSLSPQYQVLIFYTELLALTIPYPILKNLDIHFLRFLE